MNPSAAFIARPVATMLLTLGIVLAGWLAFRLLPVAPLPQVDFPTISVSASLPGASPETMAAAVATPLERALGAIAGVTEITSRSSLGSASITLQFDLSKDIDSAAREVQAALNAARSTLPSALPSNPTYRKVNPADAPIMILAMTSATMTQGQMYDVASTLLAQRLSQVKGVGQVVIGGSSLPAVRVELNPQALAQTGISTEDVRTAIVGANANRPKGVIENDRDAWQIEANDQIKRAADYAELIVGRNGDAMVRLADVAQVIDSVQDVRNAGSANGQPSVSLILNRQPGANIIETIDRVRDLLPTLREQIPAAIDLNVVLDRSPTIRASLREVGNAIIVAIVLVILVVFVFLRDWRATLIPTVAVPTSLIASFAVMYLFDYSLDNLSLMALTIATGFVVDDAVVVLENVSRHIENGRSPRQAALAGAREVGFTVLSMSVSLIAVFLPILMMGGIVGRLFREFAVTLSAAILVSLVVSLTTTPMMCARLLRPHARDDAQPGDDAQAGGDGQAGGDAQPGGDAQTAGGAREAGRRSSGLGAALSRLSLRALTAMQNGYARSLRWALRFAPLTMLVLLATIALNVHLYMVIPKGFFPQQDTGRVIGFMMADQSISFQAMRDKVSRMVEIVRRDPAVDTVTAYTGGGFRAGGQMFVSLKPLSERKASAEQIIARLRPQLAREPGINLYLNPVQDIRVGGRQANASYQYTLQADDLSLLREWGPKINRALQALPQLTDVNTDQQEKGLQTTVVFDRDAMARLGLSMQAVTASLNDLFGQRQVSTIYNPLNQYRVVLEAAPRYWQSAEVLNSLVMIAPGGLQVPLSSIARFEDTTAPLVVNHQGQFAASTISFNLPPGVTLSDATAAIDDAMIRLGVPNAVYGRFAGTAQAFQSAMSSQPLLILAALVVVYIVLGILYESTIHPLTILSTLPSAGVGALIALMAFDTEFSIIALIGVILLIGIVKKNAIMMIDFALSAERDRGLAPRDAIFEACLLRFRPIMMTTIAALFGALPLALGAGDGAELRRPLGIAIVGGLILSQMLTLYTTPVVYLYLDRLRWWALRKRGRSPHGPLPPSAPMIAGEPR
ncbi:MAG: efflux RND transporter permease subunit [Burkholderiaceae bacterium]